MVSSLTLNRSFARLEYLGRFEIAVAADLTWMTIAYVDNEFNWQYYFIGGTLKFNSTSIFPHHFTLFCRICETLFHGLLSSPIYTIFLLFSFLSLVWTQPLATLATFYNLNTSQLIHLITFLWLVVPGTMTQRVLWVILSVTKRAFVPIKRWKLHRNGLIFGIIWYVHLRFCDFSMPWFTFLQAFHPTYWSWILSSRRCLFRYQKDAGNPECISRVFGCQWPPLS